MDLSDYPRPIAPVRTPAAYIGGKKQLSKRLCGLIDDWSGDVATFFRILQRVAGEQLAAVVALAAEGPGAWRG